MYLRHFDTAHNADLSTWQPWCHQGACLGYVQPAFAEAGQNLGIWTEQAGHLETLASDPEVLTAQFHTFASTAHASGLLPTWVGEPFAVKASVEEPARFTMERTLTAPLGCLTFGVHLNGFVRRGRELWLWVATRSLSKPTFPGKLDNLVGGGQPAGLSLAENLIKECEEEAGIPASIAQAATATGTISYCHTDGRGLKRDILYCYDLELPETFEPVCMDGEVASFALRPMHDVLQQIQVSDDFKYNCNLVIIDFAIRHGILTGDDTPHYAALCARRNQLKLD